VKLKVALKYKKKKLRRQINEKFNYISSADKNKYKNIITELLFKKTIHLLIKR
jgi:hypothetical protein